jgi:N-glycosylase/DNA lyase
MIASSSAYFALKMAVNSARRDAGVNSEFELKVPCTVDIRQQACLTNSSQRLVLPY